MTIENAFMRLSIPEVKNPELAEVIDVEEFVKQTEFWHPPVCLAIAALIVWAKGHYRRQNLELYV